MKINRITIVFLLVFVLFLTYNLPAQNKSFISVKDFGAKGDGVSLDTKSIQNAIDLCSTEGGTVIFPPGTYLTGSIELKSNIDIYIQSGAKIIGSKNLSDYFERIPKQKSYNDIFLKFSLFYAEGQSNISIRGEGTIDGQGKYFKVVAKEKPNRYKDRPYVFRFVECKNLRVEGITLQNSAMWMQHYLGCEDVVIHEIKVFNHSNKNNDMIDIDGCKNVIISDCIGDTDDDGITLKSTSDKLNENVSITNCIISSHCNGFKLGTESIGGFKNIVVSNLLIKPSRADSVITGKKEGISGITIASVDGGVLDGISISNLIIDGPEVPIFIRLGNRARKPYENAPDRGVGQMNNIKISNIIAKNVKSIGCSVSGIPGHEVKNISFDNISITFRGGGTLEDSRKVPDEMIDQYPEGTMWGNLPAFGFYVRHAKEINFSDIKMNFENQDQRPAFYFNDVIGSTIKSITCNISPKSTSAFLGKDIQDVKILFSSFNGGMENLAVLSGTKNKNISILFNECKGAKNIYLLDETRKEEVNEFNNIK